VSKVTADSGVESAQNCAPGPENASKINGEDSEGAQNCAPLDAIPQVQKTREENGRRRKEALDRPSYQPGGFLWGQSPLSRASQATPVVGAARIGKVCFF
jgi:hypothetical protein